MVHFAAACIIPLGALDLAPMPVLGYWMVAQVVGCSVAAAPVTRISRDVLSIGIARMELADEPRPSGGSSETAPPSPGYCAVDTAECGCGRRWLRPRMCSPNASCEIPAAMA